MYRYAFVILFLCCQTQTHDPTTHIPLSDSEPAIFSQPHTPQPASPAFIRTALAPLVEIGLIELIATRESNYTYRLSTPIPTFLTSYMLESIAHDQLEDNTYHTIYLLYSLITKGIYSGYIEETPNAALPNDPRPHALASSIWGSLIRYAVALCRSG